MDAGPSARDAGGTPGLDGGFVPYPVADAGRDAGATPDAGTPPDAGGAADAGGLPTVQLDGRRLLINGAPYEIRAVGWNPVPKGRTHPPRSVDFEAAVERDATMMQAAGFNTVRTYVPLTSRATLDVLHRHGLMVIDSVYAYGGDAPSVVLDRVRAVADHPALLAWAVGNEWNYNKLYQQGTLSFEQARDKLNAVMAAIRTVDTRLPIINVYGELPDAAVLAAMPLTDIWALNVYRGLSFGDLFTRWAQRSTKPMMLGEYGADAYNARLPGEDQASQATATEALTREIHQAWSGSGGVALGGALFEWSDEWWKDGAGQNTVHDVGGIAPGGGPYPDSTFNEEWWGLVDIDRTPRAALSAARRGWGLVP
jgi:hypothetical protein